MEPARQFVRYAETSAGALEEIAVKCGFKVEYQSTLCNTAELQFSIEVWILGEKVGEGLGKTIKEAKRQATDMSLQNHADKFLSSDQDKTTVLKENGFSNNSNSFRYGDTVMKDIIKDGRTLSTIGCLLMYECGNYPATEEDNYDSLVHWCHGAPGISLTLASQVFPEERFLEAAADVVWNREYATEYGSRDNNRP
ncbi:hypothetical protein ABZP36_004283 [Zizania latifolia]